jgi:hypothetical protein
MAPRLHAFLFLPALSVLACAASAPPQSIAKGLFQYDVAVGPGSRELSIRADLPQGPARRLGIEDGAEPFVLDVAVDAGDGAPRPVPREGSAWPIPPCPARGCRLQYRFLLAEAASQFDDPSWAQSQGDIVLAPASTWLLRPGPRTDSLESRVRLRVATPAGSRFVTGIFPAPGAPGAFECSLGELPSSPYSAFGPLDVRRIPTGQGELFVALLPGPVAAGTDVAVRWIEDSARSVSAYYGAFPVPRALVLLLPSWGDDVGFSTALGNGGASIIARVGRDATAETVHHSWVMAHEMVHLAFPGLDRRHAWLSEGLATYVEPIARARQGLVSTEDVWRWLMRGLPQGLPEPDDRGLDNTPTWGRIYWGGALYCLLADIEIRERSGNTRSLDDALRGVVAAGGSLAVRWPIERALAAGDRATGVPVLLPLYRRMKDAPAPVDLGALYRRLGVGRRDDGTIVFDDGAELSALRRSITARRP